MRYLKKRARHLHAYVNRLGIAFAIVCLAASVYSPVPAHEAKNHGTESTLPDSGVRGDRLAAIAGIPRDTTGESAETMGFEERGGAVVPAGLVFVDEKGDSVRIGDLIKGPTILSMVYYKCANECSLLLSGIAQMLGSLDDKPGTAPNVITLSIGSDETPADAERARDIAFASLKKPFPPDRWHFLTGPRESVAALARTVGFHFVKKGDDYDHPLGVIILSPRGKVVRYIMGTSFLPVEISISLMEASSGTVQPAIARVLRACFSIDPKSHQMVFNILQVSAVVIVALLVLFITYLAVSGRRSRRKGRR